MMRKKILIAAAATVLAAASSAAGATSTTTATFTVSIQLVSTCTIGANNLSFGTGVGLLTSAINDNTTLSVTCSNSVPYNVGLDAGTVTSSTVASRLMAGTASGNTSSTIGFQLYSNTGESTVWGNTVGTNTVTGTGTGSSQSYTVYGQVPAQSTPTPDTYQTTVTATVTY